MGKKQVAVSLRKPPPTDPDAFVSAAVSVPGAPALPSEVAANSVRPRAAEGPVVSTPKGDRREVTLYLPLELARRLSLYCLEVDRDVSSVVSEAIAKALDLVAGAEKVAEVVVTLPAARFAKLRLWLRGWLHQFPRVRAFVR